MAGELSAGWGDDRSSSIMMSAREGRSEVSPYRRRTWVDFSEGDVAKCVQLKRDGYITNAFGITRSTRERIERASRLFRLCGFARKKAADRTGSRCSGSLFG